MRKERIRAAVTLLVLVLTGISLLSLLATYWRNQTGNPSITFITSTSIQHDRSETQTADVTTIAPRPAFPVYLTGAVNEPGIYHVDPGTYLYEVVETAGGLTDEAAADRINLVLCLEESRLIRIPTTAEILQEGPMTEGTADLLNPSSKDPDETDCVNINTADAALLETLPGIGPVTAGDILSYREENGRFQIIEDIMKVPGIKESRFAALKDRITVG